LALAKAKQGRKSENTTLISWCPGSDVIHLAGRGVDLFQNGRVFKDLRNKKWMAPSDLDIRRIFVLVSPRYSESSKQ
jgi:hypothetical protein